MQPMIPSRIHCLSRLPRLPSGKLDRQQLADQPAQLLLPGHPNAGPRGPGWSRMTTLWEEVLHVSRVGPHDNFFQLGGHSLKAIELVERIQRDFQRDVPPGILMEAPTPALLTERLEAHSSSPLLVRMRTQGQLPILCLIPGAYGGTIGLRTLANQVGPDQPVVGLEYDATDPADRVSLESVAHRFVREIRQRFPEGPYRLCGFSMGGLIAYEMAKELGSQVDHLILLDAYGPGVVPAQGPNLRNRLHELWTHLQILARSKPRHILERISKLPGRTRPTTSEQFELALDYLARPQSPEPKFGGPVSLIRLSHRPDWVNDPLLGWSELFPQLRVRTIVGLHGPLVLEEPVVTEAARALNDVLGLSGK